MQQRKEWLASTDTSTSEIQMPWHFRHANFLLRRVVKIFPSGIQKKLRIAWKYWQVEQKLLAIYSLAFAVTISGILLGSLVSDKITKSAQAVQAKATKSIENTSALQAHLLELLYRQQLFYSLLKQSQLYDSDRLQKEYLLLRRSHQDFSGVWHAFINSESMNHYKTGKPVLFENFTEDEARIAARILEQYGVEVEAYVSTLDELLRQANISILASQQLSRLEDHFAKLGSNQFVVESDSFQAHVNLLAKAAEAEFVQARFAYQQAAFLRGLIIFGSILSSGMLGFWLVRYLSALVLYPLKEITETTKKSIEEADFTLSVPVRSQDEIGSLSQTFNTYMQFVHQLMMQHTTINGQLSKLSKANHQKLQSTLHNLHQTQVQFIQHEKMSSLGQMVAGIAHEINNPVNFIHGNLHHVQAYIKDLLEFFDLYQRCCPEMPKELRIKADKIDLDFLRQDLPNTLKSMEVGSQRIREIVGSLRNFSRLDESDFKSVDIHEGIDNTLLILQHRLKARPERAEIQVFKEYSDLPLVDCYVGQLNQVLMNIISNAIDAIDELNDQTTFPENHNMSNRITVRTSSVGDDVIKIAIADNGPGIPDAIQQDIFLPFFTTKPVGKGTGLGMSISYQIITAKHNGTLECVSAPGQGAEFIITIPIKQSSTDLILSAA